MSGPAAASCPHCGKPVASTRCSACGAALEAGGYRVLRLLAVTPHGRTYAAEEAAGQRVALKELSFALVPTAEQLDAFEREGRLLEAIRHPGIPSFRRSFREGEGVHVRLYLAQELVDGPSLQERLASGPLPEARVFELARQVLEVLCYLHGLTPPVVHRDIKPANLVERADGSVALVDFGAARVLANHATHGATLVGTFGYMPPEQLGGTVDATSDLYALGMTLLELATGKPPAALLSDEYEPRLGGLPLSAPFAQWLGRLVAKDRRDRFPVAASALLSLLKLRPRPTPQPPRWLRPVAASLGLAAAIGVASWVMNRAAAPVTAPGSSTAGVEPAAPQLPPLPVRKVAFGGGHGLGVTAAGALYTWGDPSSGRLGPRPASDCVAYRYPEGYPKVTAVAAAGDLLYAQSEGALLQPVRGQEPVVVQLGDRGRTPNGCHAVLERGRLTWPQSCDRLGGSMPLRVTPRGVIRVGDEELLLLDDRSLMRSGSLEDAEPVLREVVAIGEGSSHAVALTAGGWVWIAGSGEHGELGLGQQRQVSQLTRLTLPTEIAAIAVGRQHTLALRRDGTVWAWGANRWGQLGDGTRQPRERPIQVKGIRGAVAVAAGRHHSLVLLGDGTVLGFGANTDGQLGCELGAVAEPRRLAGLSKVASIAGGDRFTSVAHDDGTLTTLGAVNDRGLAAAPSRYLPQRALAAPANLVSVAAGERHSLALDKDGAVWAWGEAGGGQLDGADELLLSETPAKVEGLPRMLMVGAGGAWSVAVDERRAIWWWGSLSDPSFDSLDEERNAEPPSPGPVIPGLRALAVGRGELLALDWSGDVWRWSPAREAVRVKGLSEVESVAAHDGRFLAVSRRSVWEWREGSDAPEHSLAYGALAAAGIGLREAGLAGALRFATDGEGQHWLWSSAEQEAPPAIRFTQPGTLHAPGWWSGYPPLWRDAALQAWSGEAFVPAQPRRAFVSVVPPGGRGQKLAAGAELWVREEGPEHGPRFSLEGGGSVDAAQLALDDLRRLRTWEEHSLEGTCASRCVRALIEPLQFDPAKHPELHRRFLVEELEHLLEAAEALAQLAPPLGADHRGCTPSPRLVRCDEEDSVATFAARVGELWTGAYQRGDKEAVAAINEKLVSASKDAPLLKAEPFAAALEAIVKERYGATPPKALPLSELERLQLRSLVALSEPKASRELFELLAPRKGLAGR